MSAFTKGYDVYRVEKILKRKKVKGKKMVLVKLGGGGGMMVVHVSLTTVTRVRFWPRAVI